jgi:hypothetical protein
VLEALFLQEPFELCSRRMQLMHLTIFMPFISDTMFDVMPFWLMKYSAGLRLMGLPKVCFGVCMCFDLFCFSCLAAVYLTL